MSRLLMILVAGSLAAPVLAQTVDRVEAVPPIDRVPVSVMAKLKQHASEAVTRVAKTCQSSGTVTNKGSNINCH